MYAALNTGGTTPRDSDRLKMRRHRVSRRLLVGQLAHSSDNVVSGQLIELVQRATRRCSCVLWRCCPVRRRTHTGDFVVHVPVKINGCNGRVEARKTDNWGRRPTIEATGRVEARRAENGNRRPIIWQRSSGHAACSPVLTKCKKIKHDYEVLCLLTRKKWCKCIKQIAIFVSE